MGKNIYFVADAHLGARVISDGAAHEARLVRWLDSIKEDAAQIWMLGDMFDFWFEYRREVPKGFSAFINKMKELIASGIEIHYFTGNHDVWDFGYFTREIGLIVHREPLTIDLLGSRFFLAHGDGLHDSSIGFFIIRSIFHSKLCQWLFRNLMPPRIGTRFGYAWSESNRRKHARKGECEYKGENNELLVQFAKKHHLSHPDINYYIFGHRHILLHLQLSPDCQMAILGDFMDHSNYAIFDGTHFELHDFEEN